jgi:hypothetical protein
MPDGMTALTLRGKDTEHGADLSVTADGTPNFTLTDPTGKELFSKP